MLVRVTRAYICESRRCYGGSTRRTGGQADKRSVGCASEDLSVVSGCVGPCLVLQNNKQAKEAEKDREKDSRVEATPHWTRGLSRAGRS